LSICASNDIAGRAEVEMRSKVLLGVWVALSAGCFGNIGGGDGDDGPTIDPEVANEVAVSGLRRLTAQEYKATVFDLLGFDPVGVENILPQDPLLPFDNDFTKQNPSKALIEAAELIAGDIAAQLVLDTALRAKVVPCTPASATDASCFKQFIETFGRRALRRPLSPSEVERFGALLTSENNDFWLSVDSGIRAFLQHPEFLYRVEIGEPVASDPGVYQLNDYEVATRLSYFIIGSTTPDWLLDEVAAGALKTNDGVASAAGKLFQDDRARTRVARFHALWLGYTSIGAPDGLREAMKAETDALVNRVVFDEKQDWVNILLSDETWVTPELATHYGIDAPTGAEGWVSYGDTGRKGLLSQASFLSTVSKFGDTSPTQRGLLIRTRLFCETINPPPPELNVNIDMPPQSSDPNACKNERYNMTTQDACKGCHALMDPIGFGLENYDALGQYRDTELNKPECVIDGQGAMEGVGTFKGPGELADLVAANEGLDACVARQLYRYAVGKTELGKEDNAILLRLVEDASGDTGLRLDTLILDYVRSEAFRFRREEGGAL
jgi:hypothetical protein